MNNLNWVGLLCSGIMLLPLVGAALNGLVGPVAGRRYVNWVGTLSIGLAFVVACVALVTVLGAAPANRSQTVELWRWIDLGPSLSVGVDFTLDPLSALMIMVITGVGFLIHVYSVGYMAHDEDVARFFAYMNFFIFSMLLLVLAANLVILIIGWALVALSSYLLIGFWYQRPTAVVAARKAFITQVIGDVALVLAAFLIVVRLGANPAVHGDLLYLPTIFANNGVLAGGGTAYVTGICLLIAVGAFAKSAQFPLHTWLPDAMEGPTPVSALIHAATMVTAGVYLIARFHPLFDSAPVAAAVVACVGIGTSLMAGIIALSQTDIKRVIAYSTMSQIGLMIFAVGVGAYSVGMFHFLTHAVFKALLFMAAGNVIHALRDEQDIRLMGGLQARMRWTSRMFLAGSLALAGFPLFSGWFSKEALLGFGASQGGWVLGLYCVGLLVNVLTGLYAFRLFFTVFRGEAQTARVYAAHEAPAVMLIPVLILGVGAVVLGFIEWPITGVTQLWYLLSDFLRPVFDSPNPVAEPSTLVSLVALLGGTVASLVGIGAAYRMWENRKPDPSRLAGRLPRVMPQLSFHKFYFDEIYEALLVRPTIALARAMRRFVEPRAMDGWVKGTADVFADLGIMVRDTETGLIRDYASYIVVAGVLGIVITVLAFAK